MHLCGTGLQVSEWERKSPPLPLFLSPHLLPALLQQAVRLCSGEQRQPAGFLFPELSDDSVTEQLPFCMHLPCRDSHHFPEMSPPPHLLHALSPEGIILNRFLSNSIPASTSIRYLLDASTSHLPSPLTLTTTLEGLHIVSIFWMRKLKSGEVAQGHLARRYCSWSSNPYQFVSLTTVLYTITSLCKESHHLRQAVLFA